MFIQPDSERVTVEILSPAMDGMATVAVGVPDRWAGQDHLQVESDGTPQVEYPARFGSTIRLTAWSVRRSTAKQMAAAAAGILATYAGGLDARYRIISGVLATPDDETGAVLATCLLHLDQRGIPAGHPEPPLGPTTPSNPEGE